MKYLHNLRTIYSAATPSEIAAGIEWYGRARRLAHTIAETHSLPFESVAGAIAALSPQVSWDIQQRDSEGFVKAVLAHEKWSGDAPFTKDEAGEFPHAGTKTNKRKAAEILRTGQVLDHLSGPKVIPFWLNITGRDEDRCTLDIWALRAALFDPKANDDGNITAKPIAEEMRGAYKALAAEVGLTTAQLQAVIWIVWRKRACEIICGQSRLEV